MSLNVALQSVAFYVLSCSTCAKIKHRRKAKAKAKREAADQRLDMEEPHIYRHPAPFNTNPYWMEEILMGPGPPKSNKSGSKTASCKASNFTGLGSGASDDAGSSLVDIPEDNHISGEGWNRKRYQREDEDLWGIDIFGPGQRLLDAIAKAGSCARHRMEIRLNPYFTPKRDNRPSYYIARNPPVNDLHPPVVSSQPASMDEVRWMLQPPPSAKVMAGKERVGR